MNSFPTASRVGFIENIIVDQTRDVYHLCDLSELRLLLVFWRVRVLNRSGYSFRHQHNNCRSEPFPVPLFEEMFGCFGEDGMVVLNQIL